MMPTVTQTLSTMRLTLEQTVLPALPADGAFVQEQVGLMMATLDWLVDVHESEYRYELTENEEYRAFFAAVGRETDAAPPAGDLAALRDQTRALKRAAADLVGDDEPARELLLGLAERQGRREQAWFRMTGFPEDVPGDIATVLAGAR
ncbi:hypothetical protein AB0L40_07915 [Patulibacter sp. NPDC049589]|uniref:hypothetical protein n=1 Tax=Patulibacter sp. NPDC049589 TaxID=3154731 RepID=UPI0034394EB9